MAVTFLFVMRFIVPFAIRWICFALGYWLFAGSLGAMEIAAGLLAAAIAATAATAVSAQSGHSFDFDLRWLARLAPLPWQAARDCGVVFAALTRRIFLRRPIAGEFRPAPFDPGGDTPRAAARRAMVIAATSFAPNTYATGIDRDHGTLLFHQLAPSTEPPGGGNKEWPL
jgi:hypothetical protein